KFNTMLGPKPQPRPPKDCDILGFDMEWDSSHNLLSTQLAWHDSKGVLRSGVFQMGVNADWLLRLVEGCLKRPTKRLVILVSHFATAEIGHIANATKEFSIRQFNLALEAQAPFDFESTDDSYERTGGISGLGTFRRPNQKVLVRIVDLMGFFSVSLEKVAKAIGMKKVDLTGLGGKDDAYWKTHMDELLKRFPNRFNEYAKIDAEIALSVYTRLREFFLKRGIDVVNFHTASGVGIEIFKTKYIKKPVAPFYKIAETYSANAYSKRLDGLDGQVSSYWR